MAGNASNMLYINPNICGFYCWPYLLQHIVSLLLCPLVCYKHTDLGSAPEKWNNPKLKKIAILPQNNEMWVLVSGVQIHVMSIIKRPSLIASFSSRFWLSLWQPVLRHPSLLRQTRLSLWLPERSHCPVTQGEPHRSGWEDSEVMRTESKKEVSDFVNLNNGDLDENTWYRGFICSW